MVILTCLTGWLVMAVGHVAPLVGMVQAGLDPARIATDLVGIPPIGVLTIRSLVCSAVATLGALLLGLVPAALLGSARDRSAAVLTGLALAPLLIPPQVYAYAWGLLLSPQGALGVLIPGDASVGPWSRVFEAGLISAVWLWPVVTLIVAAGWRSIGRGVFELAILDTSPGWAFWLGVVPVLRAYLLAAGCTVFAITLLEYAIPHLVLARVFATELLVLVDVGAPPGQIISLAAIPIAIILVLVGLVWIILRKVHLWQALEEDGDDLAGRTALGYGWFGRGLWVGSALVWAVSVLLPAGVMLVQLRVPGAWRQGFVLFRDQWGWSFVVALIASVLAVCLAVAGPLFWRATLNTTVRRLVFLGMLAVFLAAVIPPAALGIGFVMIYNRAGFWGYLYRDTALLWGLSLAARYGAIALLIAWLALGRRRLLTLEQARSDGAGTCGVLAWVILPAVWPALLAVGLLVLVLSLFEIVITQLVGPVGFPSIAMTILGLMHYGRDDVVITISLVMMAVGISITLFCGWLFARVGK